VPLFKRGRTRPSSEEFERGRWSPAFGCGAVGGPPPAHGEGGEPTRSDSDERNDIPMCEGSIETSKIFPG
jgi:hypothetical protein